MYMSSDSTVVKVPTSGAGGPGSIPSGGKCFYIYRPLFQTFLGPKGTRFAHNHLRAQKCRDFQGPPLQIALEMDLPSSKLLSQTI